MDKYLFFIIPLIFYLGKISAQENEKSTSSPRSDISILQRTAALNNVGIGTLAPLEKLHINDGSIRLDAKHPFVKFYSNSGATGGLDFYEGGINAGRIWRDGISDELRISADASGIENHLSIKPNGAVGVGGSSSGPRLQIKGFGTGPSGTLSVINSADNSLLHVRDDGKIGMGTSTPLSRLHIQSDEVTVLRLQSSTNPLVAFYKGASYDGFIQAFEGDFYLGKSGTGGDIVVSNAGQGIRVTPFSQVIIGGITTPPASGYRLSVDGKVACEEVLVKISGSWPDYVFDNTYPLLPLEQLEKEIDRLHHLPGIPSAQSIESNGIEMGEMQKILVEKIEELTLYIIDLQKQIDELKQNQHPKTK